MQAPLRINQELSLVISCVFTRTEAGSRLTSIKISTHTADMINILDDKYFKTYVSYEPIKQTTKRSFRIAFIVMKADLVKEAIKCISLLTSPLKC